MLLHSPEEQSVLKSKTKELTFPAPDLHLIVQMISLGNTYKLQFRLYSLRGFNRYSNKKFGEITLLEKPEEKVQKYYTELSEMANQDRSENDPAEAQAAETRLDQIGKTLWKELIPKELKDEYWKFCSHVRSLLITSDEPWIPWEIIKPYDGNKVEPFWCQKFAISRWLSESGNIETLPVGIALPVAPSNIDLEHLNEEIDFLGKLSDLHPNIKSMEPLRSYLDVLKWLDNEDFSIMHFACHGEFDAASPANSPIILSDRCLKPSDINTSFGERRLRPLIFINACHTGRTGSSLTWSGGWPVCFVNDAQVGAFIGTMWEVNDQLAVQFAKSFYISLLKNKMPIAEAFRYAREEIRRAKPYNSSWLAYVLYADPNAMMLDF
jgi:hypothetical protein